MSATPQTNRSLYSDPQNAVALNQRIEHVETSCHVSKHRVVTVEVRLGRVREKILTPPRIRPRQGHAYSTSIVPAAIELIANGVPGSAAAITARIAVLCDKVRHDAMKHQAVIVPAFRERDEVRHGHGRICGGEVDLDGAPNRHDGCDEWPVAERSTNDGPHLFQIPCAWSRSDTDARPGDQRSYSPYRGALAC